VRPKVGLGEGLKGLVIVGVFLHVELAHGLVRDSTELVPVVGLKDYIREVPEVSLATVTVLFVGGSEAHS
jgi:hypothetical protein